ncbi:DUF1501 domain-containing protein [Singulisphaera sp. PoT]|uniref:DUF1501 domain-containing protein n=1 Tax=Singulisphaera sp. PoT TaxID=3411797 RepID=UPI003BF481B6
MEYAVGAGSRREFLRAGLAGMGSLSLSGLLQLRAQAESNRERKAVILVWLRGGCSHLDTYDPKPDSPSEFRGPFSTIGTKTKGLRMTELLPLQAAISDKFSVLRSMAHTGGGHPAGSLQLLSGDPDPADKPGPAFPDVMSVANFLSKQEGRALPNYVGVNPVHGYDGFRIAGPAFLGSTYEPFAVMGDPSAPDFRVNFGDAMADDRLRSRGRLLQSFDEMRRSLDRSEAERSMNSFQARALELMTSPQAALAFDISREDPKLRDRYGRHSWGQQCLMARRLVEAGVDLVTTTFDGPLCGRVANWDDHAVNHHVFDALKFRAPYFDQAVSALIQDVHDRGLQDRVLVIVTGEFGRTPRISYVASSGGGVASAPAGTTQPGRDHWNRANSMIWSGGGIPGGQIIGATDSRGEDVVDRRVGPHDFMATIYRHLGIDYERTTIPDKLGRPIPIVSNGQAIPELIGRS